MAAAERRRSGQRQEQREIAAHRRHHLDAFIGRPEARVHMHPACQQLPDHRLVHDRKLAVAVPRRDCLRFPGGKRVRRGGHQADSVLVREIQYRTPDRHDGLPGLRNGMAYQRIQLDLGAQELRHRPTHAVELGESLEQAGIRIHHQVKRLAVNEKELLLDTERDLGASAHNARPSSRSLAGGQLDLGSIHPPPRTRDPR